MTTHEIARPGMSTHAPLNLPGDKAKKVMLARQGIFTVRTHLDPTELVPVTTHCRQASQSLRDRLESASQVKILAKTSTWKIYCHCQATMMT